MLHRPVLDVPDPFRSLCSTPPPFTPTALPMTGIRRSPCATPRGGLLFGHLAESTPLTGYEPKTCIDVSCEHAPINYPLRRNSFNTDYNDLTTTVAAFETLDMKEAGQSTSPLMFQEREVNFNPFCVSGFQQQAAASGSPQQVPASVVNAWLGADMWSSTRKVLRGNESIASAEGTWSRKKEIEILNVRKLCLKGEISMST